MFATPLFLLPVFLASSLSGDADWIGFRGPNGVGLGPAGSIPAALDKEKGLQWRTEIPAGYSSPIVVGERIFLTAAKGQELLTLAFDLNTGEELWRRRIPFHGRRPGANSPAAPTCTSDGKLVISLFHDFGLFAYDLDGEETWAVELDPPAIPHGLSSSPVVYEDVVILQLDEDGESAVAAFNLSDGEESWRIDRTGFTHSYATPAIYHPAEGPAQLIVSGSLKICSYSLETRELLWWVDGSAYMSKGVPVVVGDRCYVAAYAFPSTDAGFPRIVQSFEDALAEKDADGDGKISKEEFDNEAVSMSWFVFDLDDDGAFDAEDWTYLLASNKPTGGLFAIALDGRGNITESHVRWLYDGPRGLPDATSPLVVGDTLFLIKRGGILSAFDTDTGELAQMKRVGKADAYFASPVAADGRMLLASLAGRLTLVSAKRDWEVLCEVDLGEDVWSTPALAPGRVIVRTQAALYSLVAPTE